MARNYRTESNRPERPSGARYQTGSERDRYRTGGEQRFSPDDDERDRRGFEGDRSYSSGGYSEEFGYRRGRNREDYSDRAHGAPRNDTRGASGANYQSGRSLGGDYERQGRSRHDEGRFDEANRFSEPARHRDYARGDTDPQFTLARDRDHGTSTSRWREDMGDRGGYFETGNYIDDGGSQRGFGRDFERARARVQRENHMGRLRGEGRGTRGHHRRHGSDYGSQAGYERYQEENPPWRLHPRGGYESRSSWDYRDEPRMGGGAADAYGRGHGPSSYGPAPEAQSFRGRGPQGYRRSDERLKEMICERLTDDPMIDASDVTVEVQDQLVKLTGSVSDRRTKYEIEEIVEDLGGVQELDNQLRVQSSPSQFGPSSDAQNRHKGDRDWQPGSAGTGPGEAGAQTSGKKS